MVVDYHNADHDEQTQSPSGLFQINPALVYLPDTDDANIKELVAILKAKGRKAALKTAGARKKDKPYF